MAGQTGTELEVEPGRLTGARLPDVMLPDHMCSDNKERESQRRTYADSSAGHRLEIEPGAAS